MTAFNYNKPGSIVGVQGQNIGDTSVTINGHKVTVSGGNGKPSKVELHPHSGKVQKFTESDIKVLQAYAREGNQGIWKKVVIDGRTYQKK